MQLSVVPMMARNTVKASTSMKIRPPPGPNAALPMTIIMSPTGAAEPDALCIVYPLLEEVVRREILNQVTERPLNQQ